MTTDENIYKEIDSSMGYHPIVVTTTTHDAIKRNLRWERHHTNQSYQYLKQCKLLLARYQSLPTWLKKTKYGARLLNKASRIHRDSERELWLSEQHGMFTAAALTLARSIGVNKREGRS